MKTNKGKAWRVLATLLLALSSIAIYAVPASAAPTFTAAVAKSTSAEVKVKASSGWQNAVKWQITGDTTSDFLRQVELVINATQGSILSGDIAEVAVFKSADATFSPADDTQVASFANPVIGSATTFSWTAQGATNGLTADANNYFFVAFKTGAGWSDNGAGADDQITISVGTNKVIVDDVGDADVTSPDSGITTDAFTADTTGPTFTAQTKTTTTIELTYDENVIQGSGGDFSVVGNTVSSIGLNNLVVTVTLNTAIGTGAKPDVTYTAGTLTDIAGNLAATATVTPTDGIAPTFTAKTTTPTTILVTFSENVNGTQSVTPWDVDDAGNSVTAVTPLDGSGNTLTLTLGTAIGTGATPVVAYDADANDSDVEDTATAPNALGDLTPTATDGLVPTLNSAETKTTTTIDVTFSEDLGGGTVSSANFSVAGNTVTEATEAAGVVTLTLGTAIATDAKPAVTYTKGTLADTAGNLANTTSVIPTDGIAPTFTAKTTTTTTIVVTFSENVDSNTDSKTPWSVAGNTVTAVTPLDGTGNTLTITLETVLDTEDIPDVSYDKDNPNGDIVDMDATPKELGDLTVTPTDGLVPTMDSAETINTLQIEVTFSEDLNGDSVTQNSGNFTVSDGSNTVENATEANGVVTLTLGTPIATDATPAVTYTKGTVKDVAGNEADTTGPLTPSDGIAPTAAITYSPAGPYKEGTVVTITATFSEAMDDTGGLEPKIAIDGPGTDLTATAMTRSSATVYTYDRTVSTGNNPADILLSNGKDLAGNLVADTPTSGESYTVDNTAPTISSAVRDSDTQITVTLSENVTASTITKSNDGGFVVKETGAGTTYTVSAVAPGATNDEVVLTVANMAISAKEGVTVTYVAGGDGNGTVTDVAGNALATDATGEAAAGWDITKVTIISATVSSDNSYVDIVFSEGAYGEANGASPLEPGDLTATLTQNSGTATAATIIAVKRTDGTNATASPLVGGETAVRVFVAYTGTPSGAETIKIDGGITTVYDKAGNASDANDATTGDKSLNTQIALASGWNLISMPLYMTTTNISTIFDSVLGDDDIIWGYDAATGNWSSYKKGDTPGALILSTVADGKGYWVKINGDATTLTLTGLGQTLPDPPAAPPSYSVVAGWNLVGFKSTTTKAENTYLGGIAGKYTLIYKYYDGEYLSVASGADFTPGLGYWVSVTQSGTIFP